MDLDRTSPQPLYVQLADAIESDIRHGLRRTGDRLPTEEQLLADLHVSRVTVRQAMKVLEVRGLITRHRAKGTFVAGPRVMQDLSVLRGFYDTLVTQGVEPETQLLQYGPVTPPAAVRKILGQDDAVLLVRQYWAGSSPLAVVTGFLHPAAKAVPKAVAEIVPTYHILQMVLGLKIDHAELAIRAVPAPLAEARRLDIKLHAPVLLVERTTFGPAGEALEHALLHLRADAHELALTIAGPAPVAQAMRPTGGSRG